MHITRITTVLASYRIAFNVRATRVPPLPSTFNRLDIHAVKIQTGKVLAVFNRLNDLPPVARRWVARFNRLNAHLRDVRYSRFNRLDARRRDGRCSRFNRLNGPAHRATFNRLNAPPKQDCKRKRPSNPGAFSFGAFEITGAVMSP